MKEEVFAGFSKIFLSELGMFEVQKLSIFKNLPDLQGILPEDPGEPTTTNVMVY